jgi:hypothetical protein
MADQSKDSVATKTCKKCGVEKSMEDFYKNRSSKDGRSYKCVLCVKGKTRQQIDQEMRIIEQDMVQRRTRWVQKTKTCNACGTDKPWSDFKIVRKRGPYGMYDYATGRCCQCQKIHDEYMKTHPRTTVDIGSMRFRVVDERTPATEIAFAQYRSKQAKEFLGYQ